MNSRGPAYWVPWVRGDDAPRNDNQSGSSAAVASSSHNFVALSSRCGRTSRLTRVW